VPTPRKVVTPEVQAFLDQRRRQQGAAAQKRYVTNRAQKTPEEVFSLVHQTLANHGELTKKALVQKIRLWGPSLDAALSHGLNQGHFTVDRRSNRAGGSGPKAEFWSLAQPPEQLSLYDDCELPPPVQPTNQPIYAPKKRIYNPPAPGIYVPPQQPVQPQPNYPVPDSEEWGYSRYSRLEYSSPLTHRVVARDVPAESLPALMGRQAWLRKHFGSVIGNHPEVSVGMLHDSWKRWASNNGFAGNGRIAFLDHPEADFAHQPSGQNQWNLHKLEYEPDQVDWRPNETIPEDFFAASRYDDAPPDSQPTNVPQHVQNIQDAARKPNFKHYLESYLGSLSGPEYAHTVRALGASPSHDEDPHGDIFRNLVSTTPQNVQPTQTTSGRPLSPEKEMLSQLNAEQESSIGHKDPKEVRLLHLSGGMKGVFKPSNGEHPLRSAIQPGTHYRREAAASALADVIGMHDLVPPTTVRNHNGEIGSIQQFMDGQVAFRAPRGSEYDGDTDAARAAVFDYLIGNTDRHMGNWLVSPQGKLVLIDHGLSFPTDDEAEDNHTNREILDHAAQNRLRMPDLTPLAGKWPEIESELHHHGIEPEAIGHVKRRYDNVMSGRHHYVAHLAYPT